MSYNVPQGLLDILQTGALPTNIKIVNNNPGGDGSGATPDGSWANPYLTIQAAMDSMSVPDPLDPTTWIDQVWIMGGTYDEDVTISRAKIMVVYTLGFVSVGDATVPRNITWDLPVSVGVPAVLGFFPMPMIDSPDINMLQIYGNLIMDGDIAGRTLALQNTFIDGTLQSKDVGLFGAWAGEITVAAFQSLFRGPAGVGPSIAFADTTVYNLNLAKCKVEHGIFCKTSGVPDLVLYLEDTSVEEGVFTPFGDPPVTASAWLPGALMRIDHSDFDAPVTGGSIVVDRGGFEDTVEVQDASVTDSLFEGTLTATNNVTQIMRSEFRDAVSLASLTNLSNSTFQSTLTTTTGAFNAYDCYFGGDADFGDFGYIRDCQFAGDLTADPTEGYILGTSVTGTVTFPTPGNVSVDIASNSMTKLKGSSFPVGTNVLDDAAAGPAIGNLAYVVVPYDPTVPLWTGNPDPPAVYIDNAGVAQLADASSSATKAHGFAFDYDVDGVGNCRVATDGPLEGFTAAPLTPGDNYALSATTAGAVTTTPPVAVGTIVQWMGVAATANLMVVDVDSTIIVN